jgi:DNA polymerase-3 subunit alpha (Gram-positive type)
LQDTNAFILDKLREMDKFWFLNKCIIKKVRVNKDLKSWYINIEGPFKVAEDLIKELEQNLLTTYSFLLDINISYKEIEDIENTKSYETIKEWYKEKGEDLYLLLKNKFPSIIGSIPFKYWLVDNTTLTIQVNSQIVVESIINKNIPIFIKNNINHQIIKPFKVEVIFNSDINIQKELQILKEAELERIVKSSVPTNVKNAEQQKNKSNKSINKLINKNIKGKSITQNSTIIDDISIESGNVVVEGKVFDFEYRIFNNNKGIVSFNITDFSNSITIKTFEKKEDIELISKFFEEYKYVKVKGDVQFDKYTKEIVIMARDIQKINYQEKEDNHNNKRVELHTHSQFSAMDGVTSIKDIIKKAAKWGHKAIAITDHGVLQAFPEAMNAGKENDIKIIYGVEGYLIDDNEAVVWGDYRGDLNQCFVVFDIETTGLSPVKDQITEIGAVKIENGRIVDKFNTLINPGCSIPYRITKLTGITDEMVKDEPRIHEILPRFIEFCNNCILVAHNAKFDISFIKNKAKSVNLNVNNPIVDTLALSRLCLPSLKRHRLSNVVKHFGIKLENHHRAVDDAQATAEVFLNLIDIVKINGAKNIEDLNYILKDKESVKKMDTYHIIILVKNLIGLKNLYKIISKSHMDYFYKKPRIPKSLLKRFKEGLIIGTACEAGELYKAILRNVEKKELEKVISLYDYLEIQPLGNNNFLIDKGIVENREQLIEINKKIVSLGEEYNKPVVATGDVHFLNEKDEIYRRILMSGQGFQDADNQAPLYFRTTEEMLKEFDYLGKEKAEEVVITNTNYIADQIQNILPIPTGTFPPKIEGAEDEIFKMTMKKAHNIYGDKLPDIIQKRLDKELNSIINNGYAVLYLIAHKLVDKSLEDGYLVGSRGSVGSSLVATFTDITEVNPLPPHYICPECKHSEFFDSNVVGVGPDLPDKNCPFCKTKYNKEGFDIPFEVFLGFEGDKEPDIDLNFSGEYQAIAHKYTEELFGSGQVFKAGTIGTIAEKTAYGFVKNYAEDRGSVLHNAEINRLVKGCTGVKRTTGQHPGGIMVVPRDKEIYDFCPIQRPADDPNTDIITTHFDYHSLSGRLLKLDILGHDDPTAIRMLEDLTGIDATKIPLDDKKTIKIFTSTDVLNIKPKDIGSSVGTFGIPEFGTRFVRQMLEDTKPTAFSDLIRISGLSHGTDVWINNAQDLIRNNTCTIKEVISTRDDIMVYLTYKGLKPKSAFKIMEGVRKGRGLTPDDVKEMKENNVPQWYIDSCTKIKYMFPKAHAAAYVMMAFRIAYFKVHYPLSFYATYFTVRTDDFDADLITKGKTYIKNKIKDLEDKGNEITTKEKGLLIVLEISLEMYCRGFSILPVDLYESHAEKFIIKDNALLAPFNSLTGLGIKAAYNIMEARLPNKFISKEDLRERCKISKNVIEILDQHGCLKDLPDSNQLSLFGI